MPKKKEILPTGWEIRKLEEVFDIRIGGTPSRSEPKFWDIEKLSNNLWVSISDMRNKEIYDTKEYISDLGVRHSNVKRVPINTVLMSFKLTLGRISIAKKPLYTNEAIAAFVPRGQEISNEFAAQAFQCLYLGDEIDEAVKGKTLNKDKLSRLEIAFPKSLPEQVRIASVLSSVDDLLSASRLMLERWKKIRDRTAEELLLGNWEIKSLLEVCSSIRVGIASSATHAYAEKSEGVPILRNLNIKEGYIDASDLMYVSREFDIEHKKKRIQKNDVITVRTGNPGSSAVVTDEFYGCQTFTTLISTPKLEYLRPDYLCLWINSEEGKKFVQAGQAGGAQKNLNVGTLEKMPIPLPPLEEQERIVTILSSFDARIRSEEDYISQLEQIKKGLMQFLLTGRYLLGAL